MQTKMDEKDDSSKCKLDHGNKVSPQDYDENLLDEFWQHNKTIRIEHFEGRGEPAGPGCRPTRVSMTERTDKIDSEFTRVKREAASFQSIATRVQMTMTMLRMSI